MSCWTGVCSQAAWPASAWRARGLSDREHREGLWLVSPCSWPWPPCSPWGRLVPPPAGGCLFKGMVPAGLALPSEAGFPQALSGGGRRFSPDSPLTLSSLFLPARSCAPLLHTPHRVQSCELSVPSPSSPALPKSRVLGAGCAGEGWAVPGGSPPFPGLVLPAAPGAVFSVQCQSAVTSWGGGCGGAPLRCP